MTGKTCVVICAVIWVRSGVCLAFRLWQTKHGQPSQLLSCRTSVLLTLQERGLLSAQALQQLQPGAKKQAARGPVDPATLPLEQQLPQVIKLLNSKELVRPQRCRPVFSSKTSSCSNCCRNDTIRPLNHWSAI